MHKTPWYYFVFRIFLGFALIFFLFMLYWSSLTLEEEVQKLQRDLLKVQELIKKLEIRAVSSVVSPKIERGYIDQNLPNLLKEDRYYAETLPNEILPKGFVPSGTRRIDAIGKPNSLHPFVSLYPFTAYIDQCQMTLASLQFGKYETMAPELAIKMEERPREGGGSEYWIHLREGVYWKPLDPLHFPKGIQLAPWFLERHPVSAYDVKFYFDAIMNPFVSEAGAISLRNYIGDIEEIEVIDDYTLIVRWKQAMIDGAYHIKYAAKSLTGGLKALPSFVYQYFPDGSKIVEDDLDPDTYRKNSVWAEQFSTHFAKNVIPSCGKYLFDGVSDTQIRFVRNPDFFNPYAVLVESMEINFKETPEAIWQDFQAGSIDTYNLDASKVLEFQDFLNSPAYKKEADSGLAIEQISYVDRAFFYIGWNEKSPLFSSKKIRQAMTMAIDRDRLIFQNLNNLGFQLTAPFAIDSPAYDPTLGSWPFDPKAAKQLLEEEGWSDTDGDGIRDKVINGERTPFHFNLNYYVKNLNTKKNCESIRSMLLDIGIDCHPEGLDIADLMKSTDDKDFDALFFGWALSGPPEDPRQLWHSKGAKEKGSSNLIGFANEEVDAIIEKLTYEEDAQKRKELYHRFDRIIYEEQPYTLLFALKTVLAYREYVKNIFIPKDHPELVPGADISQPDLSTIWLKS